MSNNQWMGKENSVHIHNVALFSHKEEWNYVIYQKMDDGELDKPSSKGQIVIVFSHMWKLELK
jgi:hypothetical protein